MKHKSILLVFFLLSNLKSYSQNIEHYLDSIYTLVIENRITVFDSTKKPIPYKTVVEKYSLPDTSINCMWTRPKFVDNIYHASFDGVVGQMGRPDFDTSMQSTSPNFISFIEKTYDDNGNYIQDEWAFMIKKTALPLSPELLKKRILKDIKPRKASLRIAKSIQTKGNQIWKNEQFKINNIPYPMDSCMSKYFLRLKSNFSFEQRYSEDSLCTTSACLSQREVGVESDFFFNLSERVQYYKIEHIKGYWTIQQSQSKDNYLVLYATNGNLIAKYKVKVVSKNRVMLFRNNQISSIRKDIQK